MDASTNQGYPAFELRFNSLFQEGRALAFPCNERGEVDMDGLSDAMRTNYLFARAVIGRDYALPTIVPAIPH